MPRPESEGKQIAYKILGIPPNIKYKPSLKKKRLDKFIKSKMILR